MPTIRDIAQLSGVSHGTVSNVLNKRGNVSIEKILLVEEAARKLGYSPNHQAQQLRGMTASHSIAVVLPSIMQEKYAKFYSSLQLSASSLGYACSLHLTGDLPQIEKEILRILASRRIEVVVIVSCLVNRTDALNALMSSGAKIVCVERETEYAQWYVGFNYSKCGEIIYRAIRESGYSNICIVTGLTVFSNENSFVSAITQCAKADGVAIHALQTDLSNSYQCAFKLASDIPCDAVALSCDTLLEHTLSAYAFRHDQSIPRLFSLTSVKIIPSQEDGCRLFQLDYAQLAQAALRMIDRKKEERLTLPLPDWDKREYYPTNISQPVRLNILMLDSPSTAALQRLLPDFKAQTGIEVNFAVFSYRELYEMLKTSSSAKLYDVVRMDSVWVPWFEQSLLRPIDTNEELYQRIVSPLIDHMRPEPQNDGQNCYAFPFDPSVQMLFYRKDLFEDPKIRRMYYENTRQEMDLPSNYNQFNNLLKYFSRAENPLSPVEYGATIALGSISSIVCDYLPRLYSYGGSLFGQNSEPKLNSKEAYLALQNYLEARKHSNLSPKNSWWNTSVGEFAHGKTALLSVFVNHAAGISDLRISKIAGRIGFTALPGGCALQGGGMLGVTRYSKNPEAALAFIEWTCSERLSVPYTLLGGTSPCASIYTNDEILSRYPWLAVFPSQYANGILRNMPSVHGKLLEEQKIESILGQAITSAFYEIVDAKGALASAQENILKIQFE